MAKDKGSNDEPPNSEDGSEPKPESGVRFGHEVRQRRRALGMTLEDLSERCGLTPNYIGTVETGKRDPSLSTMLALAKGLNALAGEFFGATPDLSPMAGEAAWLFDRCSREVQKAIVMMLRAAGARRRT